MAHMAENKIDYLEFPASDLEAVQLSSAPKPAGAWVDSMI